LTCDAAGTPADFKALADRNPHSRVSVLRKEFAD